jgi:hypothetical protein
MQIEKKNTVVLLPADYNPRKDLKPGDPEYDKLKRSIEQFGYVEPVIWNKVTGRVVGGHQRLKVLIDMGITEVECVVVEMDAEKEKALNIALNKISGEWDKEKLALLIADLQGADFDVSLTGFDPAELDALFKDSIKDGIHDDDFDVETELKKPPITKLGDVWTLGRHRLVCGDSTKANTFDLLMAGAKANLVITDPPYNVNYEGNAGKIKNDNMANDAFYSFLLSSFQNTEAVMADDASIYVFHADTEGLNFRRAFSDAGFYLSGCCIKNAMQRTTDTNVADTPSMEPPVAPDIINSGPKLKYTIYTIINPMNLLTKYRGDGENSLFIISFFCMNSGLKTMLIMVIIDENVMNTNTNKLDRSRVSSFNSPDTQSIRMPMGIVNVVPYGIGTKKRNPPNADATINFTMLLFSTGSNFTVVALFSISFISLPPLFKLFYFFYSVKCFFKCLYINSAGNTYVTFTASSEGISRKHQHMSFFQD